MSKNYNHTQTEQSNLAVLTVQRLYTHYFERLTSIVLTQFEWSGLPEGCDARYLELTLLQNGKGSIFRPEGANFWVSGDFIATAWDHYGNPIKITGLTKPFTGNLGGDIKFKRSGRFKTNDFGIVYDNMLRTPLLRTIELYAMRLAKLALTYHNSLNHVARPFIIVANENSVEDVANYNQIMSDVLTFKDTIITTMDPDNIKTLNTAPAANTNTLLHDFEVLWKQALSELGITQSSGKRERMVATEAASDGEVSDVFMKTRLKSRQLFCDDMNSRFGLNISVRAEHSDLYEALLYETIGGVIDGLA